MKADDNKCRKCGTQLKSKNAIDVGYCLSCYNLMMADPDNEEDEEIKDWTDIKRSIDGEYESH